MRRQRTLQPNGRVLFRVGLSKARKEQPSGLYPEITAHQATDGRCVGAHVAAVYGPAGKDEMRSQYVVDVTQFQMEAVAEDVRRLTTVVYDLHD